EGVRQPAGVEGIGEGADQRVLPDEFREIRRPVFARQYAVRRARPRLGRGRVRYMGPARCDERALCRLVVHGDPWLRGMRQETGRRPEPELVTAASFRT